jgi:hypothetical protein
LSNHLAVVRVVRGSPTAEELAALIGAVLIRLANPARAAEATPSRWVRSGRPGTATSVIASGLPYGRGPHVWRTSAFPH